MQIASVHDFPLEDGDAICDAKFRVRLPSKWASYYLKRNPESSNRAELFVASLNQQDILVFHRDDFVAYRKHLTEALDQDELIDSLRVWGGEAQLDSHGRFVLPPAIRAVFPGLAGKEMKVISTLPVCLVSLEQYEERNKRLKGGAELHGRARSHFIQSLKTQKPKGTL